MSRVANKLIKIPSNVIIKFSIKKILEVSGPNGVLIRKIIDKINVNLIKDSLSVRLNSSNKSDKPLHGLYWKLILNMIKGVTIGFSKVLEINGVGYRALLEKNKLVLKLGFSHLINYNLPKLVNAKLSNKNTKITLTSIDNELLGNVSYIIRNFSKPEPYKGNGIKYSDEKIIRKEGKLSKK